MLLSIITPVRNGASTLERCLDSVFQQRDYIAEHVIVDGESNDGTVEIVKDYQARYGDDRLKLITAPPRGIANAFNVGLRAATGDWIGIINADDWYEAGAFQAVQPFMSAEHIIHGQLRLHGTNGESRVSRQNPHAAFNPFKKMPAHHPTCFVPRSVYDKIGLFQECYRIAMDYDFLLRAHLQGVRFHYTDKLLANFSSGGVSTLDPEAGQREMLASQILNMREIRQPVWRYMREKMKTAERKLRRAIKKR